MNFKSANQLNTYLLLPKSNNPCKLTGYRPINLCNISYKVVSKLLANRIKPFMNRFIPPFQSAFALGR